MSWSSETRQTEWSKEFLQHNTNWNNQGIHYLSSLIFCWSKTHFLSKYWEKKWICVNGSCHLESSIGLSCSVQSSKGTMPLTFSSVKLIVRISRESCPNLIWQYGINYRLSIRVKWNCKERMLCSKTFTFCEIVTLPLQRRNRTK